MEENRPPGSMLRRPNATSFSGRRLHQQGFTGRPRRNNTTIKSGICRLVFVALLVFLVYKTAVIVHSFPTTSAPLLSTTTTHGMRVASPAPLGGGILFFRGAKQTATTSFGPLAVAYKNSRRRTTTAGSSTTTSLQMFMGSDGGLLGIGGPEIFTILLVGYFVLGPSDLYKLVKEVGKFIQNIRTLGSDFSTTLENNMESSLQLNELRKAQRELNDAFSFRRTINVDADSEAFAVGAGSAQQAEAMAMAAMTVPPTGMADDDGRDSVNATTATTINATPKKIRRRIRKPEAFVMEKESIVNNIPESLDMPDLDWEPRTVSASVSSTANTSMSEKELSEIEADFDKYVVGNDATTFRDDSDSSAWFNNGAALPLENRSSELETEAAIVAQSSRFQQQLSGNWNDQILQVGDTLEPLALVMNKIALLEQEKIATLKRLDEEFAERAQVEEKFYQNQRRLLEDAATQVQSAAFGVDVPRNI